MVRNNLFPLPQAAEVRPADKTDNQIVAHCKECLAKADKSSWDVADDYLRLSERGWSQRRIAKEFGVSQTSVFLFIACARIDYLGNRPPFWEAYREVKEGKSDDEEKPWEVPRHIELSVWNVLSAEQKKAALAVEGDSTFNPQGESESIEWALWSWNPVTGCLHNCPYCYARDIATLVPTASAFPNGFAPTLCPYRLKAPHNTSFPEAKAADWIGHKNVFVCSMADLFGRWVPAEWIEAVLTEIRAAPQWNFLFLTK